ncbi:MFS transporter [Leucobacter sp. CSA2]|uniref:MFS transporter n=1 Tax=Leucobacter edaphi TaxID=2796472 RepID=A0A934QDA7_9MICO|nr:MFS transporter [Leucobacter edaphi]
MLLVFALMGVGFGSWLGRLPAVRDHLGASTFEMSLIGLTLAVGSVIGLILSGRTVAILGPARSLAVCIVAQALAMTCASILFWVHLPVAGAICLAVYGFTFATGDVAMNVSGASVERALRRSRMPLFHAGYSFGSVGAMGMGALAESLRIPVPLHLGVIFVALVAGILLALRFVPNADPQTADTEVHPSVHTGPITLPATESTAESVAGTTAGNASGNASGPVAGASAASSARDYSPWRDPRILIIGLIAMSMGLAEGTAADWLPLALADGRDFANSTATLILGVFFVSMTLSRIAGTWVLPAFGRVAVLRWGALFVVAGVAITILIPASWAAVAGAVLWGVGCAYGFPVGISAASDNPQTAIRGVATVSAIAYTSFLLGPMLIGLLGEKFGLLPAFWPLAGFAVLTIVFAGSAREPDATAAQRR